MKHRQFICVLILLPLAACNFAPVASPPDMALPASFRQMSADAIGLDPSAWWGQFNDPVLTGYIETALANNLELAKAVAKLTEYEALNSYATGSSGPQVQLAGSAQRGRANGITSSNYQLSVNPSWEIDFWGKLRNTRAAARADLLAQSASREAVRLLIINKVANAYIELCELDQRLAISQRTLSGRQKSLHLAQARFRAGVVSRIDQRQAESEYQSVVSQIYQLEQSVVQKENALSLLLGRNPAPIARGRTLDALTVPTVPSGLPSDLLARRPDLVQAAEALSSAAAKVGVARAGMYPSISLTGSLGSASTELSGLFTGGASTWSFAPTLNFPLFDGGQSRSKVDVSRAQLQQAELDYKKAVLDALSDTENALVDVKKIREQEKAQTARVVALRSLEQLTRRLYEGGEKDSTDFLDAQRQLLDAETTLATTHSNALKAVVALYMALGGDWGHTPRGATAHPSP